MEELSIEEKARRYDEAFLRAKNCQYDGLALSQPVKDVIEYIFPELKEEERIKSCIKKCLSNAGEQVFDNYHIRLGDCLAWIEKQDNQEKQSKKSQESTSEECKFKVGDWVVRKDKKNFGNGCKFAQITNIDKEKYWFESGTWTTDESLRLWTIQDAKNGDVLASKCSVFILRKLDTAGKPIAYCGIVEGVFYEASGYCWTEEQCYPATEEQRDLLDQKMKEAGCCLDFEKL